MANSSRKRLLHLTMAVSCAGAACESERPVGESDPPPPATSEARAPSSGSVGPAARVMPLGDSITQADRSHDSYRRPLWRSLQAEGLDVDFVGSLSSNHRGGPPSSDFDRDHEGHWGFRVDEILEGIDAWTMAHRPDVVLIHLGSNDLFQRQSVDSTLEELGELIDAIRAVQPEAAFLLAQIIPTDTPAANRRIDELNRRIPGLAASKSEAASPVVVVDQFTGFDPVRQTYDGVHPNPDGEIHLSERWLDALVPLLAETSSP